MNELKKTIFLDIDGCIFYHNGNLSKQISENARVIPGTLEKINEWEAKGYKIILTTGRKECMRKITEEQLLSNGIFYDQLVMNMNRGERILINDRKLNETNDTAVAINIDRNTGIKDINI